MSTSPSVPLTYWPAYVGLFAALLLASTCNAFLDIQYGSFGLEVSLWAALYGLTLRLGWRQRGQASSAGKRGQKRVLILGIILTLVVFIPMWGFPRAGLAMLAMLQATQNCVTVTRRQLHFGLLVSLAMVMFAATHYRADWTMLFYLVPYVTAVVFTLVAEQINRRSQDLRSQSLTQTVVSGQWAAIAAASLTIMLLGALLYAVTPQITQPYLNWRFGQLSNLGQLSSQGDGNTSESVGSDGGQGGEQAGQTGGEAGGGSRDESGLGSRWPSPAEMRESAKRPGMPAWQRSVINHMANASEQVSHTLQPVKQQLGEFWQSLKDWLNRNRSALAQSTALLAILLLLYALWRLLREARVGTWLRTRFDYGSIGILGQHAAGVKGVRQMYAAVERLFDLHNSRRARQHNTREYQTQLDADHGLLQREVRVMMRLFEDARYGLAVADDQCPARMRTLYRQIYRQLDD